MDHGDRVAQAPADLPIGEHGTEVDVLVEPRIRKREILWLLGGRHKPVAGQRVKVRIGVSRRGGSALRTVTTAAPVSSTTYPPAFSATPILASCTWRSPASCRHCSTSSKICASPVAATGWPRDSRPPLVLTGTSPPSVLRPDRANS